MHSKMISVAKTAEKINLEDNILDGREIPLQVESLVSLFAETPNSQFHDETIMMAMFSNSRHCTNIVMTIIMSLSLELKKKHSAINEGVFDHHDDINVLANAEYSDFKDYHSIHREAIVEGFCRAPKSAQRCFVKAISMACATIIMAMRRREDIRCTIHNQYLIESLAYLYGSHNTALHVS